MQKTKDKVYQPPVLTTDFSLDVSYNIVSVSFKEFMLKNLPRKKQSVVRLCRNVETLAQIKDLAHRLKPIKRRFR